MENVMKFCCGNYLWQVAAAGVVLSICHMLGGMKIMHYARDLPHEVATFVVPV